MHVFPDPYLISCLHKVFYAQAPRPVAYQMQDLCRLMPASISTSLLPFRTSKFPSHKVLPYSLDAVANTSKAYHMSFMLSLWIGTTRMLTEEGITMGVIEGPRAEVSSDSH